MWVTQITQQKDFGIFEKCRDRQTEKMSIFAKIGVQIPPPARIMKMMVH